MADISDLFKSRSVSNILVSFEETKKDVEKSVTEKEIYRAPVKPCFESIVKKLGSAFRARTLCIRVCFQIKPKRRPDYLEE